MFSPVLASTDTGTIVKWSLLGLAGLFLLWLIIRKGAAIRAYFGQVGMELRKTSWPWDPKEKGFKKFKELTDSTLVVFVAIVLLGAFVAFWDFIMVQVMQAITMMI